MNHCKMSFQEISPQKPNILNLPTNQKLVVQNKLQNIISLKLYLKVYINLVLYYNKIYPENVFTTLLNSKKIFNLSIHLPIIRHPRIEEYIEKIIDSFVNDILLISFTTLLEHEYELGDNNDFEYVNNTLKFIIELIEIQPINNVNQKVITHEFNLDFINFPIDFYQNANTQEVISVYRENLINLNTFLKLNPGSKNKFDKTFDVKVEIPDKFPLSKDKQYEWFYLHKHRDVNTATDVNSVPLKELEFSDNVMIYVNYKQYFHE